MLGKQLHALLLSYYATGALYYYRQFHRVSDSQPKAAAYLVCVRKSHD